MDMLQLLILQNEQVVGAEEIGDLYETGALALLDKYGMIYIVLTRDKLTLNNLVTWLVVAVFWLRIIST